MIDWNVLDSLLSHSNLTEPRSYGCPILSLVEGVLFSKLLCVPCKNYKNGKRIIKLMCSNEYSKFTVFSTNSYVKYFYTRLNISAGYCIDFYYLFYTEKWFRYCIPDKSRQNWCWYKCLCQFAIVRATSPTHAMFHVQRCQAEIFCNLISSIQIKCK